MGTIAEQIEVRKCEYCGKPYVEEKITLPDFLANIAGTTEKIIYSPQCDCEQKREEELLHKRIAYEKQVALNNRFANSLMTPFFQKKVFANLKKTDEVKFCKKYAETFDKNKSKGIQMIGGVGTGKTTLLAAICNELIRKGYACLFTTFSELIENFLTFSGMNSGNIANKLDWLKSFDFVVLDDIGRESYNTDRKKEIAFRIIDTLLNYEVVTCFTANPEMIEKLKTIPEQKAALDRLKDLCPNKLFFKGNSLRGTQVISLEQVKVFGNAEEKEQEDLC